MSDVTDVRVLVSGGTSGLGYAMAAELVAGGAQVVLTGRDGARTAAAVAQLEGSGRGRAVGVAMDVRDERSVADGMAAARDALGGIDVLVNNAGFWTRRSWGHRYGGWLPPTPTASPTAAWSRPTSRPGSARRTRDRPAAERPSAPG